VTSARLFRVGRPGGAPALSKRPAGEQHATPPSANGASPSSEFIAVTRLSKSYETNSESVLALDDIDFTIADGQFIAVVAVVGPSGCGKSTLLKILAGLMPARRNPVTWA
jgi:ABC-type glutathione transport system ATPase component